MTDFNGTRSQLNQARQGKELAWNELFQARERLKQLSAERDQAARAANPNDPQATERLNQLNAQIREAETAVERAQAVYGRSRGVEADAFQAFEPFSDPREQVRQFSDQYPFLLLPVRMETRFKNISDNPLATAQNELWVRVYPDDIAIDSFEETLSQNEVNAAKSFWTGYIKAGGIKDQQRGAWRGLVQSFGSGRAAYIVQTYRPTNLGGQPLKANANDIILVVPTETALTPAEANPLADYWKAVWLATGERSKVDAALAALQAAVGKDRAGELLTTYIPANLSDQPPAPLKPADVNIGVTFAVFPSIDPGQVKRKSWSQAPKTVVLPDRFVFIGYTGGAQIAFAIGNPVPSPLIVGPDPSAPSADQLRQENGDVIIPEDMKWMTDFDRAVEWGMGVRIPLTPAQARTGFDRFLVLGLRLSADENQAKALVEDLITHHQYSRDGFSLVPQGTPTNNTEKEGAGFTRADDPDSSFNLYLKDQGPFPVTGDLLLQNDGQRLAEALGIDLGRISQAQNARGSDGMEARAMNIALWPATLGYWMETMLAPVFSDDAIDFTRKFFAYFVTGRGALPAVRVGKQPYGILPTSALSKANWFQGDGINVAGLSTPRSLAALYKILMTAGSDWTAFAQQVSYVGKSGDAHQLLLDILGLNPDSVEYYQRYAESIQHIFNVYNLTGLGADFVKALTALGAEAGGMQILNRMGYTGTDIPQELKNFFSSQQHLLQGPLIDDRALSESLPVRSYTPDNRNYLHWLIDAARTSLDTLRLEQGFTDDKPPAALLYLFLRHALLQSYWGTSIRMYLDSQVISPDTLPAVRKEPDFIHIAQVQGAQPAQSESRWQYLYQAEPRVTGSPDQKVSDFITSQIGKATAAQNLSDTLDALQRLQDLPTARLERLFAEHIDLCAYRLDAWQLGLVNYQLARMRQSRQEGSKQGVYLGAYGWLEDVRPKNKTLTPVKLPQRLDTIFNKPGEAPLLADSSNGGYIHAPSLNQAVTAAVLRSGYLADASPSNPHTLAVNLSSERVRTALAVLEGIRGGQSLGALLGYQFERGLHDRYSLAEVDKFIFDLRRAFPLAGDQLQDTQSPPGTSIDAIEARNVMDGLALVNYIKNTGDSTYPFGKPLPPANPGEQAAIQLEVERLLDTADAVADLGIAESVHQALQNNYDRAGAVLDTYSKANYPPEPAVIQTPRSGVGLSHRVGLHLQAGLDPQVSQAPGVDITPRSIAEPALNGWLAAVLPRLDGVDCKVSYPDLPGNNTIEQAVSLKDLDIQPIDLLYLLNFDQQQAMSELDDRVLRRVYASFNPRPDAPVTIKYMESSSNRLSFFKLAPLVSSLRTLALRSRPLKPSDLSLGGEANPAQDEAVAADPQRVTLVQAQMATLKGDLAAFYAPLNALLADPVANLAAILSGIDTRITDMEDMLYRAGRFGIPQTGWGFLYDWKRQTYGGLLQKVNDLIARWSDRLARFDQAMVDFGNLPNNAPDDAKNALLMKAEGALLAAPLSPRPTSISDYKNTLDAARANFVIKYGQFQALLNTNARTVHELHDAILALLPVSIYDTQGIDLTTMEQSVVTLSSNLSDAAKSLEKELDRRIQAAQNGIDQYHAAAQASKGVQFLQSAATALLGEGFPFLPEFTLSSDQGSEWENALDYNQSGDLFAYLTATLKKDFPVDEWLYGVARVREKMHAFEQVIFLAEAFDTTGPELQPIQLPYVPGEPWLALDYPPDTNIPGERLLYSAHYTTPFNKSGAQCGLLLDEWSEVIPGVEETTGLTFNYDRPNSEAPNALLLVLPTILDGAWSWEELVDALNETLDMAKKRAVEPANLDATAYAGLLPATVMAATLWQISISANLAFNNGITELIKEMPNGG